VPFPEVAAATCGTEPAVPEAPAMPGTELIIAEPSGDCAPPPTAIPEGVALAVLEEDEWACLAWLPCVVPTTGVIAVGTAGRRAAGVLSRRPCQAPSPPLVAEAAVGEVASTFLLNTICAAWPWEPVACTLATRPGEEAAGKA
jgi:hypothetical protein